MALSGVPWFIGEVGAKHPPEVARLLAHAAMRGHSGIIAPQDMQVRALAVPGPKVRVMPGAIAAANVNDGQQTYLDINDAAVNLDITATGSGGGRTDLIYYEVEDSQYPGAPTPSDVANGPYSHFRVIEGVSANVETLADVDDTLTGEALALVTLPAATGTVQQGHIKDLRQLAGAPRRSNLQRIYNQAAAGENPLTEAAYRDWPLAARWTERIPAWAVRAQVTCQFAGYRVHEGVTTGSDVKGRFRVQLGSQFSAGTEYNHEMPAGRGKVDTGASLVAGDFYIPRSERGTNAQLALQGRKDSGNGWLSTGWGMCVVFNVVFYEAPDEQGWDN